MAEFLGSLESLGFVATAARSLFNSSGRSADTLLREHYATLKKECTPPAQVEEQILYDFYTTALGRHLTTDKILLSRPYWSLSAKYDAAEILGTAIQFFDDHKAEKLPITTLPPEEDVQGYIRAVLEGLGQVSLSDQFNIALDISGNNIVGAANVAMLGSRIAARMADERAYPNIQMSRHDSIAWAKKLIPIETYDGKLFDPSGDNYYFWTQFFATSSLRTLQSPVSNICDVLFENGLPIMKKARQFAGAPINSEHTEATVLGRQIALTLLEHER